MNWARAWKESARFFKADNWSIRRSWHRAEARIADLEDELKGLKSANALHATAAEKAEKERDEARAENEKLREARDEYRRELASACERLEADPHSAKLWQEHSKRLAEENEKLRDENDVMRACENVDRRRIEELRAELKEAKAAFEVIIKAEKEFWSARKFLDDRDFYNDDLSGETPCPVILEVCRVALAALNHPEGA